MNGHSPGAIEELLMAGSRYRRQQPPRPSDCHWWPSISGAMTMQPTTVASNPASCARPSTSAITGHCLCGAVTITVAGEHDPRVGACHCRMCQRWTGGLFLCFTAHACAVSVTGEVTRYRSSSFAERAFCPRCGSHLWFNDEDR